jgi:3-isopropylmalate/(R)-2-methylmalate dehydratase small subunit
MNLEKITQVAGHAVYIPGEDIDTDRIIPARFMKCVTFDGLGEYAFHDERRHPDGEEKSHPLNERRTATWQILLSGSNFGCGSSREHAPQALYRFGFRAIIAESFAEIFFGNSTTLGIPCAVMSKQDIKALSGLIEADPHLIVILDLLEGKVTAADMDFPAHLPDHARDILIEGTWDAISDLLTGIPEIKKVADTLPYFQSA